MTVGDDTYAVVCMDTGCPNNQYECTFLTPIQAVTIWNSITRD